MKKNCLVIGAKGMLGQAVVKYWKKQGWQVVFLERKDFDIVKDEIKVLEKYVRKVDVIVNCAGMIKPRIDKASIEEVLQVNAIFPKNLAKLAKKHNKMCFHIATDCVFSGKKGNYSEVDYCDAEDVYGLSKAAGDTKECMCLRTSIIGEEVRNKYSLLEWVKSQKGKTINGFTNHYWNGVTTVYLAEIIEKIVTKRLYKKGIFHIFSPRAVTKYRLVQMINKVYDLDIKVQEVKAVVFCDRRLVTIYSLARKIVNKSLKQQIKEMKDFFKHETT